VRSMVKSVNPKNLAEWPLEWFYFAFEYWATELYDQLEHPALDMTPRQAYELGMKNAGARSHKLVRFDRDFLILTCPSVESGTRKVSKARGVKLLSDYYWSDAFRYPSTWNRDVEAKIDPWDIRVCYVWLNGRWERCLSKHYGQLGQLSLTEMLAYTAEVRRKRGLHSKELSANQVVEWAKAYDPNNFKDALRLRQESMRALQAGLGMGAIEPEPTDLPPSAFALPAFPLALASIPPTTPSTIEDDDDYELF
jgi:putative transposase